MITRRTHNAAAVLGPLTFLLVPKCPLCLLPLLAAFGIAVPSSLMLDAIIAITVVAWAALYFTMTSSPTLRACAIVLASFTVCGRILSIASLMWSGVILMTLLAVVSSARCHPSDTNSRCSIS